MAPELCCLEVRALAFGAHMSVIGCGLLGAGHSWTGYNPLEKAAAVSS